VSSYNAAGDIITNNAVSGSLTGTSIELQLSDFSTVTLDNVNVSAPPQGATNGSIEFTINGETYRSRDDIGAKLAANGVYQFKSLTNPSNIITFKVGQTDIDFDTSDKAQNFETALKNALGVGQGGASLKFQVGVTTKDTLSVRIDSVTTDKLGTSGLDVLTQEGAAAAADAIDLALGVVTSVRATVGALQSRFNFASANIESSIQNQDAARGVLLDTDIASESTNYATNQVKLQAGISVLAQANQQLQSLLKLIG
jgi:flagellin-like hook-associated protein FlgL